MKALLALAVLGACALPAYADCTYPTAPARIPDGATATLQEMVDAQKAVKQFDQQINEYTNCIKLEEAAQLKGDKLTDDQKKAIQAQQAAKNNAAVDADQALADRLNEQIRVYKTKQSGNKG
jgi:hypothetical protein